MKVTLKSIPLPPLMIGPGEAEVGDVVCFGKPDNIWWVTRTRPYVAGVNPKHLDEVPWDVSDTAQLLSRIGGMPTQSHRLGDLPIGSIVPGREINRDGTWKVKRGVGLCGCVRLCCDRVDLDLAQDTRIAVAYESIELEEPDNA